MTGKERFIKALKREKIVGHVPTFELVFYLTMEKLGKVHPEHRVFCQWNQMSVREKEAQLSDIAYVYGEIARIYGHSAVFVQPLPGDIEDTVRFLEIFREKYGDEFYVMMHGDPTKAIPSGDNMVDFSVQLYEDPESVLRAERDLMHTMLDKAEFLDRKNHLLDGFALCSDYCFNTNPFFSPQLFGDVIAPVLEETIRAYHSMGYYAIKHTDGNIMPIIEQIIECGPDALHSLDPQGGVDLAYVKKKYGSRVALIGNVNCGLLQTGSEEEVFADVRRALRDGMPGYGYIFSTSNCVYTGLSLERYELMNSIWRKEGIYPE